MRAGLVYDQDPTNVTNRNVRLSDNDRFALAIGARYQATKALGVDVGYSHVFFRDATINNLTRAATQLANIVGTSKNTADLIGAQLTWNFA